MNLGFNTLKFTLAVLIVIAMIVALSLLAVAGPPLPPPPPGGEGSGQPPPPPGSPRQDQPPQPPKNQNVNPPPPTLSKDQLRKDALRELQHAYAEYNETLRLLKYASEKDVNMSREVRDLLDMYTKLYTKSFNLYKEERFIESRVYAHLSVEALHGVRDIITHTLAAKGIVPPPPPPPP